MAENNLTIKKANNMEQKTIIFKIDIEDFKKINNKIIEESKVNMIKQTKSNFIKKCIQEYLNKKN